MVADITHGAGTWGVASREVCGGDGRDDGRDTSVFHDDNEFQQYQELMRARVCYDDGIGDSGPGWFSQRYMTGGRMDSLSLAGFSGLYILLGWKRQTVFSWTVGWAVLDLSENIPLFQWTRWSSIVSRSKEHRRYVSQPNIEKHRTSAVPCIQAHLNSISLCNPPTYACSNGSRLPKEAMIQPIKKITPIRDLANELSAAGTLPSRGLTSASPHKEHTALGSYRR